MSHAKIQRILLNLAIASTTLLTTQAGAGEYADDASVFASSTPVLSCFVDTPAYDQFTQGGCFSVWFGGPITTTAVFQVFNISSPGNYDFNWSIGSCSGEQCVTNIRAYRPLTVSVTVTENATGQSWNLSATAEYERGF